jgi:hypothetical protein
MNCECPRGLLPWPVAAVLLLGGSPVWAQPSPEVAPRRQLLERAVVARDSNDHATALTLFLEAGAIQMRPGLRMSIAQEEMALGRTRDACTSASRCIEELRATTGAPDARVEEGCAALVRELCGPVVPVRASRPVSNGGGPSVSASRSRADQAVLIPQTPHPREEAGRTSANSSSSRWWLWTGLSVLVVGGVLGGLAAGGVFDRPGPIVEGTAYTVEALTMRPVVVEATGP